MTAIVIYLIAKTLVLWAGLSALSIAALRAADAFMTSRGWLE